jgi:hypothetical protein
MYSIYTDRAYNILDMFGTEGLEEALRSLGAVLEARHLTYRLLVAGGSSLLLLGFVDRATADLDVVGIADRGGYLRGEPLPAPLVAAVADVGRALDAARWAVTHDPSPGFRTVLVEALRSFGVEVPDATL